MSSLPPLPLDPDSALMDALDPPIGQWRKSVARPAPKYAQQAYRAVSERYSPAQLGYLSDLLNQTALFNVDLSSRMTPIDMFEFGEAMRLASAVSFCERIYETALQAVKLVDTDFEVHGVEEHLYLAHYIRALLARLSAFQAV